MALRVQYFGQPYPDTPRYYWVDVRFPCCAGPLLGPVPVMTAEFLDQNNVVLAQWDPEAGATEYILLQTETPTVPAAGEFCVVARGGATGFSDTGSVLTQYPDPAQVTQKRPAAGKSFEVAIAKPSPRPDRRQTHPDSVQAVKDAKKENLHK